MIKEELAILLSRKLSGEASIKELKQLSQWMKEHPEDQFFAELLQTYWINYTPSSLVQENADQHFTHIMQAAEDDSESAPPTHEKATVKKIKIIKWLSAAAIIISITIGTAWWYQQRNHSQSDTVGEVFAERGAKSHLQLPDGTKVWLNSDSKIYFNRNFSGATREVTLEGEAFFDVVKNSEKPFIVHTSAFDIKVLGTAFNVKAYRDDKTIETTLLRGLVEIENKNNPHLAKILLRPQEKLVFDKTAIAGIHSSDMTAKPYKIGNTENAPAYIIKTVLPNANDSSFEETAWIHNRLVFEGDSFIELAEKMERWFNVEIHFKNQKIAAYRLRGAFQDETIEQALKGLQLIAPFKYHINGRVVEIY